jgi:hypothetical protein
MIKPERVPLTADQHRKLLEWLSVESFSVLLRVVESRANEEMVKCANDAMGKVQGQLDRANAQLEVAREWHQTVEHLKEIARAETLYYVTLK